MYEVEVKVRADHDAVREGLADVGAEPMETVEQVDTYFGHPVRDFAETDEALRIRREKTADGPMVASVTYKGPLVDEASKTREERETVVEDGETMAEILDALGFVAVETVEKVRERFAVDGYTVTLDTVDGLGTFVEVETEAEAEAVEPARDGALDLLRKLGLDPSEQIRTSYLGLLLDAE